jgi:hypothetical protein
MTVEPVDEEPVVEDDELEEDLPPASNQDQGPYTGMSMDIPEVPYNPVGNMDPAEVAQKLADNQSGPPDEDDELDDDVEEV